MSISMMDLMRERLAELRNRLINPPGLGVDLAKPGGDRTVVTMFGAPEAPVPPPMTATEIQARIAEQNARMSMYEALAMQQAHVSPAAAQAMMAQAQASGQWGDPVPGQSAMTIENINRVRDNSLLAPKEPETVAIPYFLAQMTGTEVAEFLGEIERQLEDKTVDEKTHDGLVKMRVLALTREAEIRAKTHAWKQFASSARPDTGAFERLRVDGMWPSAKTP